MFVRFLLNFLLVLYNVSSTFSGRFDAVGYIPDLFVGTDLQKPLKKTTDYKNIEYPKPL